MPSISRDDRWLDVDERAELEHIRLVRQRPPDFVTAPPGQDTGEGSDESAGGGLGGAGRVHEVAPGVPVATGGAGVDQTPDAPPGTPGRSAGDPGSVGGAVSGEFAEFDTTDAEFDAMFAAGELVHEYLSTGCWHGHHDYCKSMTGYGGSKRSGRCKFCDARCTCSCHAEVAGDETHE